MRAVRYHEFGGPEDEAAEAQRRVVEDRPFGRVLLDPQT